MCPDAQVQRVYNISIFMKDTTLYVFFYNLDFFNLSCNSVVYSVKKSNVLKLSTSKMPVF